MRLTRAPHTFHMDSIRSMAAAWFSGNGGQDYIFVHEQPGVGRIHAGQFGTCDGMGRYRPRQMRRQISPNSCNVVHLGAAGIGHQRRAFHGASQCGQHTLVLLDRHRQQYDVGIAACSGDIITGFVDDP
jgi:hypothetical protein